MSKHYEFSVVMPYNVQNGISGKSFRDFGTSDLGASEKLLKYLFNAGAAQVALYSVENDNRRFIKYFYEPSPYEEKEEANV